MKYTDALKQEIVQALYDAIPDDPDPKEPLEDHPGLPWMERDAEAIIPIILKARVSALRETRNAFYRRYADTPPLLDEGRTPTPDERVGAWHAMNVAMGFIIGQMDKIEEEVESE